jgi:hypothetical protein
MVLGVNDNGHYDGGGDGFRESLELAVRSFDDGEGRLLMEEVGTSYAAQEAVERAFDALAAGDAELVDTGEEHPDDPELTGAAIRSPDGEIDHRIPPGHSMLDAAEVVDEYSHKLAGVDFGPDQGEAVYERLGAGAMSDDPEEWARLIAARDDAYADYVEAEAEAGRLDPANTAVVRGGAHNLEERLAERGFAVRYANEPAEAVQRARSTDDPGELPAPLHGARIDRDRNDLGATVRAAAFAGGPPDPTHGPPDPAPETAVAVDAAATAGRLDERGVAVDRDRLREEVAAAHEGGDADPGDLAAAVRDAAAGEVPDARETAAAVLDRRGSTDWTAAERVGDGAVADAAALGARLDERGVDVDDADLVPGVAAAHRGPGTPSRADLADRVRGAAGEAFEGLPVDDGRLRECAEAAVAARRAAGAAGPAAVDAAAVTARLDARDAFEDGLDRATVVGAVEEVHDEFGRDALDAGAVAHLVDREAGATLSRADRLACDDALSVAAGLDRDDPAAVDGAALASWLDGPPTDVDVPADLDPGAVAEGAERARASVGGYEPTAAGLADGFDDAVDRADRHEVDLATGRVVGDEGETTGVARGEPTPER